jgi:hypothetical protein
MQSCAHFMHYFLRGACLYAFLPIAIDLVLEQACQNSPVQADPVAVNTNRFEID